MDVSRVLDLVRPFFENRRVLRQAAKTMSERFDLGLGEEDERAMRAARRAPLVIDREAALRLMTASGPLVDAAVRKRPLFAGAPFTLPGRGETPGA